MSDTNQPGSESVALADAAPGADASVLIEAIDRRDVEACRAWLDGADSADAVHVLAGLSDAERVVLLELVPSDVAADVLAMLPEPQAIGAMEEIDASKAAEILEEMPSDERADVIKAMDEEGAEAILTALDADTAENIRSLAAYDEGSAGAIMLTEYLAFPEASTVKDVLADLEQNAERYADYNIQYTYVIAESGELRGVLPLRNLLLARRTTPLSEVMIARPILVRDTLSIDDLRTIFDEYSFMGLPVVDGQGRLLGVVQRVDLQIADAEEADNLYRQSQGIVGGEELRSMPLLLRSRRRLAWLSANIVLNIAAASMIALQQDTLEAVIALAVFLPIISDMSGCSGNQSVAVTMRELTLGILRPRDAMRVLVKEVTLGMINGAALGVLIGGVAYLWKGNIYLSGVVGVSLALNTTIAVCIGGLVPLLLKKFKADPALASGPILTTITDMCGFFIVLSIASTMVSRLA